MEHRTPLLIVLAALAVGLPAFFLFFYDDGSMVKMWDPKHAPKNRKSLAIAASAGTSASAAPASTSENVPATAAPPAESTAPAEGADPEAKPE